MATGRKTVVVGQVIDPTVWGNPLWDQSVQTFASAADRTTQFPNPLMGAVTWLDDVKRLDCWNGAAWVPVSPFVPPVSPAWPPAIAGTLSTNRPIETWAWQANVATNATGDGTTAIPTAIAPLGCILGVSITGRGGTAYPITGHLYTTTTTSTLSLRLYNANTPAASTTVLTLLTVTGQRA